MDEMTNNAKVCRPKIHPLMKMTHHDKQARAAEKSCLLLDFLATGEIWTTLSVIAPLINASEQTSRRLVQKMIRDGSIKVDTIITGGAQLKIYGITKIGMSLARHVEPCVKAYEIGRTHPDYALHHIECQRVRLVHEQQYGAIGWVPERALIYKLSEEERRGKKMPDALCDTADGGFIAIEVELNIKSLDRMKEALKQHLEAIFLDDVYFAVYYYTYKVSSLERLVRKIKTVTLRDGLVVELDDSFWLYNFGIYDLKSIREELNELLCR